MNHFISPYVVWDCSQCIIITVISLSALSWAVELCLLSVCMPIYIFPSLWNSSCQILFPSDSSAPLKRCKLEMVISLHQCSLILVLHSNICSSVCPSYIMSSQLRTSRQKYLKFSVLILKKENRKQRLHQIL